MRNGMWMQTFTGKAYYPADPHPNDVDIYDIAHALSQICRYAGHCKRFYSVAEHSVNVSRMVPREHALQALLHDATEAYCQDIPSPLKHSMAMSGYRDIEARNRIAICSHFNLDVSEPPEVKEADRDILLSEHKVLFGTPPKPWEVPGAKDRGVNIIGWHSERAYDEFLFRFFALMDEYKRREQ